MKTITLHNYPIVIGDIRSSLPSLLKPYEGQSVFVLTDTNTRTHCLPLLMEGIPGNIRLYHMTIPAGEQHKNIQTCETIWQALLTHEADRHALLLNLGGGVIGDMGGFCAATYKRGIDFIQIPTTLLAQVDASVGGKLGIDFGGIKNSIGTFHNPMAVCVDTAFLNTLNDRERRSGWAEILKHALIADADQWPKLIRNELPIDEVVFQSIQTKQRIVEADPFEKGIRKYLNFGHTIGHAIEAMLLDSDQPLLHGEAVAAGMVAEAYLSVRFAGLPKETLREISQHILPYFALPLIPIPQFDALISRMYNDKKNIGKEINFTLLKALGQAEADFYIPAQDIADSLSFYNRCLQQT
jgi:3-dehydroquinate synthase